MIDAITCFKILIFTLLYLFSFTVVYFWSVVGVSRFVRNGLENHETLGGVCCIIARILLALVSLVVWFYALAFILFLFFEPLWDLLRVEI